MGRPQVYALCDGWKNWANAKKIDEFCLWLSWHIYANDHMSEWADTLWQGYFDFYKIWQVHYLQYETLKHQVSDRYLKQC